MEAETTHLKLRPAKFVAYGSIELLKYATYSRLLYY